MMLEFAFRLSSVYGRGVSLVQKVGKLAGIR